MNFKNTFQYFISYWKKKTGEDVKINQSHGGSGKQARSVIDGLEADVVTLALGYDISAIAKANLLSGNWQKRFPNNSTPYTSAIVFLVKKGNPKQIKDWDDLAKKNVQIITPNPKTSGGAKWNYLSALVYANQQFPENEAKVKRFLTDLFSNVVIYDTGARGASISFVNRNIGDVLIAWESEALLLKKQYGKKFEIVTPSISILAQPQIAAVDRFSEKHNNNDLTKEYLDLLYSKNAQEIIAKHFYRPSDKEVAKKYKQQFPVTKWVSISDLGGWDVVQKKHFDDNGVFDQITKK